MKHRELLLIKAPGIEQGHGQGVAQGQHHQRAGGGRQGQRAGLGAAWKRQDDVGQLRKRRSGPLCVRRRRTGGFLTHHDDAPADSPEMADKTHQLLSLAAFGEGQQDGTRANAAQIAVYPLHGMHENRRRARAR